MRKRIFLAVLLIAALVLSTSCGLIQKDAAVDAQTAIIEVAGKTITKAEVKTAVENTLSYQQYIYSMYGMTFDATDATNISDAQDTAISALIQQAVVDQKVTALGFDTFTADELTEMQTSVDTTYTGYVSSIKTNYFADTTLTGDELDKAVQAKMVELGYPDKDTLLASKKATQAEANMKASIVKDLAVTDEEIQTEYDAKVEAAKSSYADSLSQFGTDITNGTTIYYRPAGYRYVKNILRKLSDADSTTISDLQTQLTTKQTDLTTNTTSIAALPADATTDTEDQAKSRVSLTAQKAELEAAIADLQSQQDAAKATAYAALQPTVDEIVAKLAAGEDFDALMTEYNEDTGMQSEPAKTNGYPVCAGDTNWVDAFTEAAMTLTKIGDVSAPFRTDYGIHIVKYISDISEGAVPLADVKDTISASVLTTKQDALYTSTVSQWVTEANAKIYKDRLAD
ncbi:MAG: peptidylprolyl isomerase [Eubacteriales bacterium]|nr:peptidylprolyl isomerase [Eubacteriales bacterium]